MHIFRADPTNAGDWWSPPMRYFPFRDSGVLDIMGLQAVPAPAGSCVVVGGGGLGRTTFREALRVIRDPARQYRLVAWGVGADSSENREGSVPEDAADILGDHFAGFDLVGTRIWKPDRSLEWVPCASCLHPMIAKHRDVRPSEFIGVYEHKRVPIVISDAGGGRLPTIDNGGDSIEQKLEFISRFEYIISNSYHGVYWATLLNRKVLCMPFKNGLYSFRHRPVYIHDRLDASHLDLAVAYPEALDECRMANLKFHSRVIERFGDI